MYLLLVALFAFSLIGYFYAFKGFSSTKAEAAGAAAAAGGGLKIFYPFAFPTVTLTLFCAVSGIQNFRIAYQELQLQPLPYRREYMWGLSFRHRFSENISGSPFFVKFSKYLNQHPALLLTKPLAGKLRELKQPHYYMKKLRKDEKETLVMLYFIHRNCYSNRLLHFLLLMLLENYE